MEKTHVLEPSPAPSLGSPAGAELEQSWSRAGLQPRLSECLPQRHGAKAPSPGTVMPKHMFSMMRLSWLGPLWLSLSKL